MTMRNRIVCLMLLLPVIIAPVTSSGSTRRGACINNLRQIDGAKDEYALEYGGTNGTQFTWDNIGLYIKNMSNKMFCPNAVTAARSVTNYSIQPLGPESGVPSGRRKWLSCIGQH